MTRPTNKRLGFYHIHSGQYECGMAWWNEGMEGWWPCSKEVNHKGQCGLGNLSAY